MPISTHPRAPSAAEYNLVHPMPSKLTMATISPSQEPGDVTTVFLKGDYSRTSSGESYGVKYADGSTYPLKIHTENGSLRDRAFIENIGGNNTLIVSRAFKWTSTRKIHGFVPMIAGQKPSKQKFSGETLYTYGTVTHKRNSSRYEMIAWDGSVYHADEVGERMSGRGEMRFSRDGKACGYHEATSSIYEAIKQAILTGKFMCALQLDIGPGIDPCLLIAFVIAIDKMKDHNTDSD